MSAIITALLKRNLVDHDQVSFVRSKRAPAQKPIQDLLVELGFITENSYFAVAAEIHCGPLVDLEQATIDPHAMGRLPLKYAKYYGVFPLMQEKGFLILAMSDPSDYTTREEIHFLTGLEVKPLLCRQSQITKYIRQYYQEMQEILRDVMNDAQNLQVRSEDVIDLAQIQSDDPAIIRFVNKVLHDAIEARASDVHVEPQDQNVHIRYRVDGYLKSIIKIPYELQRRLVARIKILSKLDISEERKIQEGRIKVIIDGKKIDLRISLIPTFYGEKIVIRILDARAVQFDLNVLGFEPQELASFKEVICRPQGVILVTGPTGSGKTTTLYSALQYIKCETKNIITIEDPIEYLIEGISQLQLNHYKDVTFASSIKSILRQDPNVILIGEVRDRETAEIAFQASMTGHLVFSTLHTNGAASSITRLMDIGVESYLIASSMVMIVAQRLIRLICPHCRQISQPDPLLVAKYRKYLDQFNVRQFYSGAGCEHCNYSGYYGRASIFEVLKITEKIKELIYAKASESLVLKEAMANGMRTLVEAAVMKVSAGLTTLKEITQVVDLAEHENATGRNLDDPSFPGALPDVKINFSSPPGFQF